MREADRRLGLMKSVARRMSDPQKIYDQRYCARGEMETLSVAAVLVTDPAALVTTTV
jgi:hypothetical protein